MEMRNIWLSLPIYVVLLSEHTLDIFAKAGFIKTKKRGTKEAKSSRDKIWKHEGRNTRSKQLRNMIDRKMGQAEAQ